MINRKLGIVIVLITLSGCESRDATVLTEPAQVMAPLVLPAIDDSPGLEVTDPVTATLIIYQHGSKRPNRVENCDVRVREIPASISALANDPDTYIWFLCSAATDGRTQGSYIFKRVAEVDTVLNKLISAGVQPQNIFLAGHSAGGWASLMAAQEIGQKFNGAIAFAPACCGTRYETERFPQWRESIRPEQINKMLSADRLRALVFAYADDLFNRPEDLRFLTDRFPDSVELVSYDCDAGHKTYLNDCQLASTSKIIQDFVAARKQDQET